MQKYKNVHIIEYTPTKVKCSRIIVLYLFHKLKNMETTTPDFQTTEPVKRTTFLLVLCILTFIGSGFGLLSASYNYLTANSASVRASEAIQRAQEKMDNQNTPEFAKNLVNSLSDAITPENIRKKALLELVSNLFTLLGALLMFNQKKAGFFLYIAGIAVLLGLQFIMGGFIGALGALGVSIFGVAFIVMYGFNLKCMVK